MSEDYINKELYEAGMKEIRALIAASEARHEKMAAEMQKTAAQIREDNALRYADIITAVNAQLSSAVNEINGNIARMFSFLSVFMAGIAIILTIILK